MMTLSCSLHPVQAQFLFRLSLLQLQLELLVPDHLVSQPEVL
jgi:hypothetical protein